MAVIVYAPQGSGMSDRALEQLRMFYKQERTAEAFNWKQLLDPKKWALLKGMEVLFYVRDDLPPEFRYVAEANPRRLLPFKDAAALAGLQVAVEAEG